MRLAGVVADIKSDGVRDLARVSHQGPPRGGGGIAADGSVPEAVQWNRINVDVLAHMLDHLIGPQLTCQFRIEMEISDDCLQTDTAEDLLRHALQTLRQVGLNVGSDVAGGHT